MQQGYRRDLIIKISQMRLHMSEFGGVVVGWRPQRRIRGCEKGSRRTRRHLPTHWPESTSRHRPGLAFGVLTPVHSYTIFLFDGSVPARLAQHVFPFKFRLIIRVNASLRAECVLQRLSRSGVKHGPKGWRLAGYPGYKDYLVSLPLSSLEFEFDIIYGIPWRRVSLSVLCLFKFGTEDFVIGLLRGFVDDNLSSVVGNLEDDEFSLSTTETEFVEGSDALRVYGNSRINRHDCVLEPQWPALGNLDLDGLMRMRDVQMEWIVFSRSQKFAELVMFCVSRKHTGDALMD